MAKSKRELANSYHLIMESCAAYVAVNTPLICGPDDVVKLIRPFITAATGGNRQECMMVLLLDTKNHVIGIPRECTKGLLDQSPVHPREIFREAVRDSAASVVLVHNHPSGDPTPSRDDAEITRRLVEAGKIVGIRVADHIVIGQQTADQKGWVSMREKNLVAFE